MVSDEIINVDERSSRSRGSDYHQAPLNIGIGRKFFNPRENSHERNISRESAISIIENELEHGEFASKSRLSHDYASRQNAISRNRLQTMDNRIAPMSVA